MSVLRSVCAGGVLQCTATRHQHTHSSRPTPNCTKDTICCICKRNYNNHCSWRWTYKPETCRAEVNKYSVASSWKLIRISIIIYVCQSPSPSTCPRVQVEWFGSQLMYFDEEWYLNIFWNSIKKIHVSHYIPTRVTGVLHIHRCKFMTISSWILLAMKNNPDTYFTGNWNIYFMFNNFFLIMLFNPLQTKRRLLYLKPQSVPRCKHF